MAHMKSAQGAFERRERIVETELVSTPESEALRSLRARREAYAAINSNQPRLA